MRFKVTNRFTDETFVSPDDQPIVCECADCGQLVYWRRDFRQYRGWLILCGACGAERLRKRRQQNT